MSPLIPMETRQIGGIEQQTVSAREIWQFVESKQQFSHWIKDRIEKWGFVDGEDFNLDKFISVRLEGSREVEREITDYWLTIDMAKELAMVEANEKGREVRRYFIECERRAKAAFASAAPAASAERRVHRYTEDRPMPRLDRYQNSVINRQAAALSRQLTEVCRQYLLHELAGLVERSNEGRHARVDDYTLDYVIYRSGVEDACTYGHVRAGLRFRAVMMALRG